MKDDTINKLMNDNQKLKSEFNDIQQKYIATLPHIATGSV